MATYLDFYREVGGTIPRCNDFLAQRWVNRAKRDIYESRFWSFLRSFGYLVTTDSISTGTFTVTQDLTTATADADATTALTGLTNPAITARQIRFASGPLYNINDLTGSTLTFDRAYGEATTTGIAYTVYRAYFGPPFKVDGTAETDFLRYISVVDPIQPQKISVNKTTEWLDMVDPQRTETGLPSTDLCAFVAETADQLGLPQYEAHPHPTTKRYWVCTYMKRSVDFSADSDVLPKAIPENLLIARALYHGYTWAMANMGRYSELRVSASIWPQLRKEALDEYSAELARSQVKDDDTMKQAAIPPYGGWPTWFNSFANQMNFQGGTPTPANPL